jgi:hypothetical protein
MHSTGVAELCQTLGKPAKGKYRRRMETDVITSFAGLADAAM